MLRFHEKKFVAQFMTRKMRRKMTWSRMNENFENWQCAEAEFLRAFYDRPDSTIFPRITILFFTFQKLVSEKSGWFLIILHLKSENCLYCYTEVGRAPLIHFQKIFFKKGFYRSKLARELKFYTWIIIAGSKSLKKGQKMLKKATDLV